MASKNPSIDNIAASALTTGRVVCVGGVAFFNVGDATETLFSM
jgi:hypothetical protein